jgi:hypothetical protein
MELGRARVSELREAAERDARSSRLAPRRRRSPGGLRAFLGRRLVEMGARLVGAPVEVE